MTPLGETLLAELLRTRPIPFRDFMNRALYDPDHGYYNTSRTKIGPDGDYYTSSNVHPYFGATLASSFVKLWTDDSAGCTGLASGHTVTGTGSIASHPLQLAEFGPGTGQLAFDILSALKDDHPAAFEGIRYYIIETSEAMRALQREKLADFRNVVEWIDPQPNPVAASTAEPSSVPALPKSFRGIVFSNEFIDALPVHALRTTDAGLEEMYIAATDYAAENQCDSGDGLGAPTLCLRWLPLSTPRIEEYVKRVSASFEQQFRADDSNGQQIEVNLDALEWLRSLAEQMDSGYIITIDYGDLAPLLWSPDRRDGTLRSFRNHELTQSVLENVGDQDLTASVNFTGLIEYGRDFRFELVSYEPQSQFLLRNGFLDRIVSQTASSDNSAGRLKQQLASKNLIVPGGASHNFRVLIQRKRPE